MPKVLVVDDEAYRTQAYRTELARAGFEVLLCTTVDEARDVLDDPDQKIDLLIQDLQMGRPLPHDKLTMSNGEWEDYNKLAGLWFLVKSRDWLASRRIPVLILTQRQAVEFAAIVRDKLESQGVYLRVFRKIDTPAKSLPGHALSVVKDCQSAARA